MSVEIKADIRHWLRELDKKYFFVMLGFAVMVYFPLISQRLVNTFDGLWNGSWFIGGFWELSIGRWLWCVADAVRFGVQTEPLNALLTLSMMVLGITLLRRLFVERDNALTYFAGMVAISGAKSWRAAFLPLYVTDLWLVLSVCRACGILGDHHYPCRCSCRLRCGYFGIELGFVSG